MAKIKCFFCDNEWEQPLTCLLYCDVCTMAGATKRVVSVGEDEIRELWQILNANLSCGSRFDAASTILYRVRRTENLLRDLHILPLLWDTVLVGDIWAALKPDQSSAFLTYVEAGALVPFLTPYFANYQAVGWGSSADVFRRQGEIGEAVVDSGSYFEILSQLPPDRRAPFIIAAENLAAVLASFDLNHPGYNSRLVADALIQEGYFIPDSTLAYEMINSVLIASQLLNIPVLFNSAYEVLISHKYGWSTMASSRSLETARRFLSRIQLEIPVRPTPTDILRFRESDQARQFRDALKQAVTAPRDDPAVAELSVMSEFMLRVQRFNEEARKVGSVEVAVLSGIASTVGALLAGLPGAAVGGIGTAATTLLAQQAYSWMYERAHKDWAVVFNRWSRH